MKLLVLFSFLFLIGCTKISIVHDPVFELIGDSYSYELYDDLKLDGYIAYEEHSLLDLSDLVVVNTDFNNELIGDYYIEYSLSYKDNFYTLKRDIEVVAPYLKDVTFLLNGSNVKLERGDSYIELGFRALYKDGRDLSDYVSISKNYSYGNLISVDYTLNFNSIIKTLSRSITYVDDDLIEFNYKDTIFNNNVHDHFDLNVTIYDKEFNEYLNVLPYIDTLSESIINNTFTKSGSFVIKYVVNKNHKDYILELKFEVSYNFDIEFLNKLVDIENASISLDFEIVYLDNSSSIEVIDLVFDTDCDIIIFDNSVYFSNVLSNDFILKEIVYSFNNEIYTRIIERSV